MKQASTKSPRHVTIFNIAQRSRGGAPTPLKPRLGVGPFPLLIPSASCFKGVNAKWLGTSTRKGWASKAIHHPNSVLLKPTSLVAGWCSVLEVGDCFPYLGFWKLRRSLGNIF